MINVYILGFHYAFASSIVGVIDLLSTAGTAWNFFQGKSMVPKFNVRLATPDGQPIRCLNNIVLQADCAFDTIDDAQVVLVPSIGGDVEKTLARNPELVECLRWQSNKGVQLAS